MPRCAGRRHGSVIPDRTMVTHPAVGCRGARDRRCGGVCSGVSNRQTVHGPSTRAGGHPRERGSVAHTDFSPAAVLSPDGSLLALVARSSGEVRQLFVRRLDRLEATVSCPAPKTPAHRSFPQTGNGLGFSQAGSSRRCRPRAAPVVVLCDAPNGRGASWSEAGWIAFTPNSSGTRRCGVSPIPVAPPESLTVLGEGEVTHRWPQVLPGAKGVLYIDARETSETTTMVTSSFNRCQPVNRKRVVSAGILWPLFVQWTPDLRARRPLVRGGLRPGTTRGHRLASPGPRERVEKRGHWLPRSSPRQISAQRSIFPAGQTRAKPLQWLRRNGTTTVFRASPVDWSNPRLSSGGHRLAVDIFDGRQTDVWLYDDDRDTPTQLTLDQSEDWMPVWTPDGTRVVFRTTRDSRAANLFWQRADGGGIAERLTQSRNPQIPRASWHPSGNVLAFVERARRPTWTSCCFRCMSSRRSPRRFSQHAGTGVQPGVLS